MPAHLTQWLRFILSSLAALLLVVSPIVLPSGLAQLPNFTPPNASQPLPSGVERRGTLESAAVRLDGKELFRIASPTVLNRNEPGTQIPVEVRAREVEANLVQAVANGSSEEPTINPQTLKVVIEAINGQPVLFVTDRELAEPEVLLTVTGADAQYNSANQESLAAQWQAILAQELREAIELRRPEAVRQQVAITLKALLAVGLLTLILGAVWTVLGRRRHQLELERAAERAAAQNRDPTRPATGNAPELEGEGWLFPGLSHHLGLQQRLQTVRFLRWLLFWLIAFVWVVGIAYSLNTFPQTRYISRKVVVFPVVVLLTWFLTGLVNRITDLATDRFIRSREQEEVLNAANLQRITTIANVIKGLKMTLLYTLSILWVLQWLNLASGTVLTLGAVIAVAVSFAAQNLVKDFVNGFLILLEDQFRIGDMVRIGTVVGMGQVEGLVESLNLRITQLRSPAGNLISLPNSTIAQVENMSRNWARADFQIEVAYNTDVDRALTVVRETVDRMAADPEWRSLILDTREVFGVEQLTNTGIVIRVWIKTMPLKQWDVARELRRRLKIAFDRHQIQIGMPQQVWVENGTPATAALQPGAGTVSRRNQPRLPEDEKQEKIDNGEGDRP